MGQADAMDIRRVYAENMAALNAGDVPALVSLYTEDAVHLRPDTPDVVGKESIRAQLESELGACRVEAAVRIDEIEVSGRLAFARGTYLTRVFRRTGDDSVEESGKWLDVLHKQPDESWKIARAIWNSDRQF